MNWTSVDDTLPTDEDFKWIAYKTKEGRECYTCGIYTGLNGPGNWIDEIGKRSYLNPPKAIVTHWMNLPYLPDT